MAVIEFLQSDPVIADAGLATPLSVIANALNDCRRGGRPAILFRQSKRTGRPTNQAFDGVKAAIASAIDVLISVKVARKDAGKFIAAEARQLGLRQPNGKAIGSTVALGWRDEIETSKSEIGTGVYRLVRNALESQQPIDDVDRAKALARDFLRQAQRAGF